MPDWVQPPGPSMMSRSLKVLAISAMGLLLAAGFCGLDAHLYPHAEFGGSALAFIGFILALLSALGMVGSLFALLIAGIVGLFRT